MIIFHKEQRGFPLAGKPVRSFQKFIGNPDQPGDEFPAAALQQLPVQDCFQAVARQGCELAHLCRSHLLFFGSLHDCPGQRVFRLLFQGIGLLQQCILTDSSRRDHIRHLRFAAGDRTGLIQGDNLYFTGLFQ